MATLTLYLFVVILGLDLGGGLYEMRVVMPMWMRAFVDRAPDALAYMKVAPDAGPRWWIFVTPTVALMALAALLSGLRTPDPHRTWRLAATILELVVVTTTFVYFVPNIIQMMSPSNGLPPDVLAAKARLWAQLNWGRAVLTAVAWVMALRALSLPAVRP